MKEEKKRIKGKEKKIEKRKMEKEKIEGENTTHPKTQSETVFSISIYNNNFC